MAALLDIHPFEKRGLGVAPFRFVGMSEKVYCACPGAPEQPGGCCDYCGNGIRYCFHIRSADGKEFVVGCECVKRTDKASLVNATEFDRAVNAQKRKARQEARAKVVAREEVRIEKALALYPSIRGELAKQPHPQAQYFKDTKTLADWADFVIKNAGHSGRLALTRMIEKIVDNGATVEG